jgi:hypothetical protein
MIQLTGNFMASTEYQNIQGNNTVLAWTAALLAVLLLLPVFALPAAVAQEQGGQFADPGQQFELGPDQDGEAETDAAPDDMQALADEQLRAERERAAMALRASLDDLGSSLGSYDPALIEMQVDLGQALIDIGQASEAIEVLGQALQLVRINDGLYSERQLQLLSQLMHAHYINRDWDEVDDYHHLKFLLESRLYEPESAEFSDALLALGDWRLQASRNNLLGRPGSQQMLTMLQDLQTRHDESLAHAKARGDLQQQWALLYARALADVEITRQYNYQAFAEGFSAAPRYITQTFCRTVATSSGGSQRVCWQETVSNPDYYNSAANQRRMQLERARSRLQATQREMNTLLSENPEFALAHEETTEAGQQTIQRIIADLQRESRRSVMRY